MASAIGAFWVLTPPSLQPGAADTFILGSLSPVQAVTVTVTVVATPGHCSEAFLQDSDYAGWMEPSVAFCPQPSLLLWQAELQEVGRALEAAVETCLESASTSTEPGLYVPGVLTRWVQRAESPHFDTGSFYKVWSHILKGHGLCKRCTTQS